MQVKFVPFRVHLEASHVMVQPGRHTGKPCIVIPQPLNCLVSITSLQQQHNTVVLFGLVV